jgi:DNA-binding response OmpR family regulator
MNLDESSSKVGLTGTVLCIEDQPVSMALVEEMLAAFPGIRILTAFNGRDGVRLARAERPDLVLLDMQLPDIGGLEVVRALCEPISQRQLRVVLLTSDSFSIEVVKAMSLGALEYWPKPLTFERATSGLRRLLGNAASPGAGSVRP